MFSILLFAFGCIKQNESITNIQPHEQCAFVGIDKVATKKGLIFTQRKSITVEESLFYCCPTPEGRPFCKKAAWEPTVDIGFGIPKTLQPVTSVNNPPIPSSCEPSIDLVGMGVDAYKAFIQTNDIPQIMKATCYEYEQAYNEKITWSKK